jgi:L-cysteine:1D-myo-inositol 2-amino-2-deoxy-alpha-D-glucopyranoside ligase
MAIRLAIITHHYRQPWEWHEGLLELASARLERWRASGEGEGALRAVRAALDDDLGTPDAVAAIDRAVAAGQAVSHAMALLGLR